MKSIVGNTLLRHNNTNDKLDTNTKVVHNLVSVEHYKEVNMEKREQVRSIIESQKGKFFTVIFSSKQDGTVRLINGRTGVHKYVKGTGVNPAVGKSDLLSAFNVKKNVS